MSGKRQKLQYLLALEPKSRGEAPVRGLHRRERCDARRPHGGGAAASGDRRYPSGVGRSSGADRDHRCFDVPLERGEEKCPQPRLWDTNKRRRRHRPWPEALKREIVAATLAPGSSVSVVPRRYDVNADQVFAWRRRYRGAAARTGRAAADTGDKGRSTAGSTDTTQS
jgi:hypothetical protein